MRVLCLSLALTVGALTAPAARAQYGPEVPGTWSDPAYRHFLTSPYSYRTYSAYPSGYGERWVTPFGVEGYAVEPGYLHERITPRGYQSFRRVPGYATYRVVPPAYGFRFYDPGYPPR